MDYVCPMAVSVNPRRKLLSYAAILKQRLNILITGQIWTVALDTVDAVAVLSGIGGFTVLGDK